MIVPVPALALVVALLADSAGSAHAAGAAAVPATTSAMAPGTRAFLATRGIHVTGGAAPGYVEDAVCGECHQDLAASFAAVGMSRSFYRPRRSLAVARRGR